MRLPSQDVETLVIVDCDMQLLEWDFAIPKDHEEFAVTRDASIDTLCNLLDNLTLPVAYISQRNHSERKDLQEWLRWHGFPQGKLFMPDPGEKFQPGGLKWYRSAIHAALKYADLEQCSFITDGLNMEVQQYCYEQSWLHLAI